MTKRAAPKTIPTRGVFRTDTPTCALCGWTGHIIEDVQSPYRNCWRRPGEDLDVRRARHLVTPLELGVRT